MFLVLAGPQVAHGGPSFLGQGRCAQLRQDIQLAAINEAKPGLSRAIILTVLGTRNIRVSGYCKAPGCKTQGAFVRGQTVPGCS